MWRDLERNPEEKVDSRQGEDFSRQRKPLSVDPESLGGMCIASSPEAEFSNGWPVWRVCVGQFFYVYTAAFAITVDPVSTSVPNRESPSFFSGPSASFCRLGLASPKNDRTVSVNIWGAKNWSIVQTLCASSTLPPIEYSAEEGGSQSMAEEAILPLLENKLWHRDLEHRPPGPSSQQKQWIFVREMGLLNDYWSPLHFMAH